MKLLHGVKEILQAGENREVKYFQKESELTFMVSTNWVIIIRWGSKTVDRRKQSSDLTNFVV